MNEQRPAHWIIQMIGANYTGKTVNTRKIIEEWRKARPEMIQKVGGFAGEMERKYKVVAFDPKLQFKGLVDEYIYPDKNWAWALNKNPKTGKPLQNALVIFDDYKTLIPGYLPTPGMFELFSSRWHYNLNFIFSCHSPSHVLEMIQDYITEFYIFHTKGDGKFKDTIANRGKLIQISQAVNDYTATYGLGLHPQNPGFMKHPNFGQNFPFMIFDTTKPYANPKAINFRREYSL